MPLPSTSLVASNPASGRFPGASRISSVDPGLVARMYGDASLAARNGMLNQARQIEGVTTSDWLGPLQPLAPFAPQGTGWRTWDYPVGINIRYQPRQEGPVPLIGFEELRFFSRNVDICRIIIENRKQQLQRQNWQFMLKNGDPDEDDPRIEMLNRMFEEPDPVGGVDFGNWMGLLLEEMLTIDAPCVFIQRGKNGQPVAFRHVDGSCYSDDTEVLTRDGWIPWPEVKARWRELEFATRNKQTREFEWQKATYYHEAEIDGELCHFSSRTLDLLVTENHRMVVSSAASFARARERGREQISESIVTAGELFERVRPQIEARGTSNWAIPATSTWRGTEIGEMILMPSEAAAGAIEESESRSVGVVALRCEQCGSMFGVEPSRRETARFCSSRCRRNGLQKPVRFSGDDFVAFMGMYLSEGSFTRNTQADVRISQQPSSKGYTEYRELLVRIFGKEPCYTGHCWVIGRKALYEYVSQFGYAPDKYVPEIIKNASARQLKIFWHFYLLGDGHREQNGREGIYTSSLKMADDLQEIAQKIGLSAGVYPRPNREAEIHGRKIRATTPAFQIRLRTSHYQTIGNVEKVPYSGKVHCVSVPNEVLYVRRNGRPAWCGNTIKILVNLDGSIPMPPSPAYQQIIKGVPIVDLDRSQLFYSPRNLRPDFLYGYSPVESIVSTLNLFLRREIYRIQYYSAANQPAGLLELPPNITNEQIQQIQEWMDISLKGNTADRWLMRNVPNGTKYQEIRPPQLQDTLDEWVAQIVCYAFGVPPTPFMLMRGQARANAESTRDQSKEEGLAPLIAWFSNFVTKLVYWGWGWTDIKFGPVFAKENDPQIQANLHKIYVGMAIMSINEAREDLGREPIEGGDEYRIYESTGPIPISTADDMAAASLQSKQNGSMAFQLGGKTGASQNAPEGSSPQDNPNPSSADGGAAAAKVGTRASQSKVGKTITIGRGARPMSKVERMRFERAKPVTPRQPDFVKVGDLLIPRNVL